MIESLTIQNYALIDKIELDFREGFNIITGETGAGKSIMLGALSMLLGNRADSKVVRDRDQKSIVEATFRLEDAEPIRAICSETDIDWDDTSIILRREISPGGRSRSFINDSPVALSTLRDVAIHLVDLHSQHQNLLLASADYQLSILDSLMPDKSYIDLYRSAFEDYRNALRQYVKAKKAIESAKNEEEYIRYQLEKLIDADLVENEQEDLERERDILTNVAEIKNILNSLNEIFSESETSLVDMSSQALQLSESLSSLPEGESIIQRIESVSIEIKDIASSIESIGAAVEMDPSRLEYIEDHLSDIYTLQRRHGVETVSELIALRESLSARLSAIDTADDRLHSLAAKAKRAKASAQEAANALTEQRKEIAAQFASELQSKALPLGMKNLRVEISVSPTDMSQSGADAVEFLFAFNKNQPLMPVKETASGGEISRLMLTVKSILADKMNLPSIIFDEIDTGVSGEVAVKMGQMMKQISKRIQVVAITHLPQVAALGDIHFKVFKQDSEASTSTRVVTLDESKRIGEIAMMLSGDSKNAAAIDAAKSLLTKPNIKLPDSGENSASEPI